jgi:hypothetical protein
MRLEQLVDVGREEGDPVARPDATFLECDGEPPYPLPHVSPREAARGLDDCGPVGEDERRALEEGERRQRGMRDAGVHELGNALGSSR